MTTCLMSSSMNTTLVPSGTFKRIVFLFPAAVLASRYKKVPTRSLKPLRVYASRSSSVWTLKMRRSLGKPRLSR